MHTVKDDVPMLFIGGCPRSGTTLVKRILDAHSQIFCGPEFGHMLSICNMYNQMKKGVASERISAYADKATLEQSFREFIMSFIAHAMKKSDANIFAEKTPDNVRAFCWLHELFPQAKFVHVIRNPLDVVASYMDVGSRKGDGGAATLYSALEAAKHWKTQVLFPQRFKDIYNSQSFQLNYMEVHYEDIVKSSKSSIRKVCDFVGVGFEESMCELNRPLEGDASSFGNIFYTKEEYVSPILNSRVGTWRQRLSKEDIQTVLQETKYYICKFGYMNEDEVNVWLKSS